MCERVHFKTNNKWDENNYQEAKGVFGPQEQFDQGHVCQHMLHTHMHT